MFALLFPEDQSRATASVSDILQRISKVCDYCRPFSSRPLRFLASVTPDELLFNHEIAVGLLWLESRPVLHVISTHTCFQCAAVRRAKNVEAIWSVLLECWCTIYTGYPRVMRVDHESAIASDAFRTLARQSLIVPQLSRVESHNCLGSG